MGSEKEVAQIEQGTPPHAHVDDQLASIQTLATEDHTDVAHGLYQESLEMDPVERERIAQKVLLKLDFCVLPMVSVLQARTG